MKNTINSLLFGASILISYLGGVFVGYNVKHTEPVVEQAGALMCKADGRTTFIFSAEDGKYLGNGEWLLKAHGTTIRMVKSMVESCAYLPGFKVVEQAPEQEVPPTTALVPRIGQKETAN